MNKILVIATGWHFSSHFYEKMAQQIVPDGWEIDYYCVAHRTPEDENTIKEKDDVRHLDDGHFLDDVHTSYHYETDRRFWLEIYVGRKYCG